MKGEKIKRDLIKTIQKNSDNDNLVLASFIKGMRAGEKLGGMESRQRNAQAKLVSRDK